MIALAFGWAACGWGTPAPTSSGPAPTPSETARSEPPRGPGAARRPGERVKPAERDPSRWAAARCNDGTPFGYAIRPGDPNLWVINVSGGYFCEDDRAKCADRAPRLVTTPPEADGAPVRMKGSGVFSRDPAINPTFASATQVDADYCSSDLWLGASTERQPTTGDPVSGWYFSGRLAFRALLEGLVAISGLKPADPNVRILVVGTSAGGAGVVGNLDQIVEVWDAAVRDHRVKIVLDGSWVPPTPEGARLPNAARWGAVEPGCDRDLRAQGGDPRACVEGPRWWPYAKARGVPVLVQISGLDTSQTPVFGVEDPASQAAWRVRVRASLEDAQVPWVYSVATPYHVVAIDERFAKGPPGRTFRDLLDAFWRDGPPERVFLGGEPP